ncbi:MAG: sulfite exporter TauE/SafE family protein [Candidatus Sabulitectum sp.]|nr:sulfite exporter TauE/SafE family protein [Candidatus Sabulitectum sp.]
MLYPTLLIICCAGILQGFCGFGYSLLALPLICLFAPAQWAVPVIAVSSLALNIMVLSTSWRNLKLRGFLPLALAGMAFTPLGAWMLSALSDTAVRVVIGIAVTAASLLSLSRWVPHVKRSPAGMALTGALSGIFNGLTTFSGPPAVIYLSATETEKDSFRANLSTFFLALTLIAIPSFVTAGVTSAANLVQAAIYLPAAATGGTVGIMLAKKVDSSAFRKTALTVLSLLGIFGATQALF